MEVLPVPEGAEITINNLLDWASFNILRLFSNSCQLTFDFYDVARYFRITALGPDGIHLPPHLLDNKINLSSHRLIALQHIIELIDMAPKANNFFHDITFLSHDGNFLPQTGFINLHIYRQLLNPLPQPILISRQRLRPSISYYFKKSRDCGHT